VPVDTVLFSHNIPAPPLTRSLSYNKIGEKGASALAAVLKATKITVLECAKTSNQLPSVNGR